MKRFNESAIEEKFEKIMSKYTFHDLSNLVLQLESNYYHVFGQYFIKKKDSNNIVVSLFNGDDVHSFYSMKSAMCWCVFDKRKNYASANRIVSLDDKISGLEVGIAIHTRLSEKAKTMEEKLIFLAKLNEEKIQKREMTEELNSYIAESYNWQQRQFDLKTKQ